MRTGSSAAMAEGTTGRLSAVDRGQMAVFISRAMAGGDGNVPTGPATASFTDVPTDSLGLQVRGVCQGRGRGGRIRRRAVPPDTAGGSRADGGVRGAGDGGRRQQRAGPGPETPTFTDVTPSYGLGLGLQVRGVCGFPRRGGRVCGRDLSADPGGDAGPDGGVCGRGRLRCRCEGREEAPQLRFSRRCSGQAGQAQMKLVRQKARAESEDSARALIRVFAWLSARLAMPTAVPPLVPRSAATSRWGGGGPTRCRPG